MKTRYNYIKPETEVVTLEMEDNVMMNVSPGGSASQDFDSVDDYKGGAAGGRQRNFWGE